MAKKIVPFPHQVECLKRMAQAFKGGAKVVLFVMATGLGKTYTSAFNFRDYRRKHPRARGLFLAHRNEILEQGYNSYEEIFGESLALGRFSGYGKDCNGADMTFASFQSMKSALFGKHRQRRRRLFGQKDFDYVAVDESHHGHARSYKKVIEYFQPRVMTGMTATPERMDMKNIREIFGEEVYSKNLAEAMREGLVCPVDYHIMADEIVRKGKIKLPPHLVSIQSLNRTFFSRRRDTEIVKIIGERTRGIKNPRIMVFCPSIHSAERFAMLMPNALPIHSSQHKAVQRDHIDLFRSGAVNTVVTVDQFNEGIDIPEANVIVFLRSTQSQTVFLQQLGRGLRKRRGKRVLVLDFVASCERIRFIDAFQAELKEPKDPPKERPKVAVRWGKITFEHQAQDVLELLQRIDVGLSREVLIEYLQKLAQELGRVPTSQDMDSAKGYPSKTAYYHCFGSWNAALRAASFTPQRERYWSKAQLLAKFKELASQLGRTPKYSDFKDLKGFPSSATYENRFGSLQKVVEMCGLEPYYPHAQLTRKQLIAKFKQLAKRLGKVPSTDDMNRAEGFPSANAYTRCFGSWNKTVEAAGSKPVKVHIQWTKEQLIAKFKQLAKRLGRVPSIDDMDHAEGFPSSRTYVRRFGSWEKIVKLNKGGKKK